MRRSLVRILVALCLGGAALVPTWPVPSGAAGPAPAALPTYTLSRVAATPDIGYDNAMYINDAGQVAFDGGYHAFLSDRGVVTDLGTLGGDYTRLQDMNAAGDIVGYTTVNDNQEDWRAFVWHAGTMTGLGGLTPGGASLASGINAGGQIVGYAYPRNSATYCAVAWQGGAAVPYTDCAARSAAWDINDAGQLAGVGLPAPAQGGERINNAGQALGNGCSPDGHSHHACLLDGEAVLDLGTLGGDFSQAGGLNDRGQVVGYANRTANTSTYRAFLWQDGAMRDLNDLIAPGTSWTLEKALGINNRGQIVGLGWEQGVGGGIFLLTPTPTSPSPSPSATPSPSAAPPASPTPSPLPPVGPSPPASPVPSVSPAPAPTTSPVPAPTFADVPPGYWAHDPIGTFARRGITMGCDVGRYCPERPVTRAEMAVFLDRTLGLGSPATPTNQRFTDVPPAYWAYAFIDRFATLGITTGCGGVEFCPDRGVTRAEMAAFLIRALGKPRFAPATPTFADVPASHPQFGYIEALVGAGVTTGCGTNEAGQRLYCPDRGVTRAEMAVLVIRAFP